MRFLLTFLMVLSLAAPAFAQGEGETPAPAAKQDEATFDERLDLAKKMQSIRPVREQVNKAIDAYVQRMPEKEREPYRQALLSILNYDALAKISIDAMAETYTVEELKSMVEYFSKPEAKSASDKFDQYSAKVYPEIGKMLDKAIMRVRTGGTP